MLFRSGGLQWSEYIGGTAWALAEAGHLLSGWEGVLAGDVPIGAGFIVRCLDCGAVSFAAEDGSWQCRLNGCYHGRRHIDPTFDHVATFRAASNQVQWRPR